MESLIENFRATKAKATLKDIANITSLSLSAVSQALNPSNKSTIGLSEESIKKVREVAKKINYRTHWGAVSTRSNFLYNLAFLKLEEGKIIQSPFLPSFCRSANAKNFAVSMLSVDKNTCALPSIFKNNRLDGLVIDASQNFNTNLEAEIISSNIPRIYLNKKLEQNAIYVDEIHSASEITNYLIERSHKNIVFLKPDTKEDKLYHYSILDSEKGYVKAMKANSLEAKVQGVDYSLEYNQRIDSSWLDFDNLPDAILTYDDDLANAIAKVFYRKELKIPKQISIASCKASLGALSAWCPLSTMESPYEKMGKTAFEMLFKLIENDNKQSQRAISFKSKLIIGESTK